MISRTDDTLEKTVNASSGTCRSPSAFCIPLNKIRNSCAVGLAFLIAVLWAARSGPSEAAVTEHTHTRADDDSERIWGSVRFLKRIQGATYMLMRHS